MIKQSSDQENAYLTMTDADERLVGLHNLKDLLFGFSSVLVLGSVVFQKQKQPDVLPHEFFLQIYIEKYIQNVKT